MGQTSELHIQLQDELINTINAVDNGNTTPLDALLYLRNHRQALELSIEITKQFEEQYFDKIVENAEQYGGKYKGHEIKAVNGRKIYDCTNVPEYQKASAEVKKIADKYKSAFEGVQRGIVQITTVDGVQYWVDENGELQPFPELKHGKSYLTIKNTGSVDQF
jgi:hypothetical protein